MVNNLNAPKGHEEVIFPNANTNPLYASREKVGALYETTGAKITPEVDKSAKDALSKTKKEATNATRWETVKKGIQQFLAKRGPIAKKIIYFMKTHPPFGTIKVENNKDQSLTIVKNVTQGITANNTPTIFSAEGVPDVKLPQQFGKDVARMNGIAIGSYSLTQTSEDESTQLRNNKRPEIHSKMMEYFDNDPNVVRNVQILLSQQMVNTLHDPIFAQAQAKSQDYVPQGLAKFYSVEEKGGNVHISVTMTFAIIDTARIGQKEGKPFYVGARSEVIVPKDQLKVEIKQQTSEDDTVPATTLFPDLKVVDSFTGFIPAPSKQTEEEFTAKLRQKLQP